MSKMAQQAKPNNRQLYTDVVATAAQLFEEKHQSDAPQLVETAVQAFLKCWPEVTRKDLDNGRLDRDQAAEFLAHQLLLKEEGFGIAKFAVNRKLIANGFTLAKKLLQEAQSEYYRRARQLDVDTVRADIPSAELKGLRGRAAEAYFAFYVSVTPEQVEELGGAQHSRHEAICSLAYRSIKEVVDAYRPEVRPRQIAEAAFKECRRRLNILKREQSTLA